MNPSSQANIGGIVFSETDFLRKLIKSLCERGEHLLDIYTMKDQKWIEIYGARQHNLKNFDLKIPKEKVIIVTGPSGSGKSSLAFNTLYAEGQRRYMESLSTYARQFLEKQEKPDVDDIKGISPT